MSYTIDFLFPTIASTDKIFPIDSSILSSSISHISMRHFNLKTSRNPCICWVRKLFPREKQRSDQTSKGTKKGSGTGEKNREKREHKKEQYGNF